MHQVSVQGVEQQSLMEFMQAIRGGMKQREMAEWLGVSQGTVNRLVNEARTPHETTLEKIAAATGVPLPAVRAMARRPPGVPYPFRLPPEANQLSERKRDLVRELVSVLLEEPGTNRVTR